MNVDKEETAFLDLEFFSGKSFLSLVSLSKSALRIRSDFMKEDLTVSSEPSSFTELEFIIKNRLSKLGSYEGRVNSKCYSVL